MTEPEERIIEMTYQQQLSFAVSLGLVECTAKTPTQRYLTRQVEKGVNEPLAWEHRTKSYLNKICPASVAPRLGARKDEFVKSMRSLSVANQWALSGLGNFSPLSIPQQAQSHHAALTVDISRGFKHDQDDIGGDSVVGRGAGGGMRPHEDVRYRTILPAATKPETALSSSDPLMYDNDMDSDDEMEMCMQVAENTGQDLRSQTTSCHRRTSRNRMDIIESAHLAEFGLLDGPWDVEFNF